VQVAGINTLVQLNKVTRVVVLVLAPAAAAQVQLGQVAVPALSNLREALDFNHLLPEPRFIMRVGEGEAIKVLWVGVRVASAVAGQEDHSHTHLKF
jgi:hypothetical protein